MKTLLLTIAITAAANFTLQAQSKSVSDSDNGVGYGKYMEVQPLSYSTSSNGKKIMLQPTAKRTEPIMINNTESLSTDANLIADAKTEKRTIRHDQANKGE